MRIVSSHIYSKAIGACRYREEREMGGERKEKPRKLKLGNQECEIRSQWAHSINSRLMF